MAPSISNTAVLVLIFSVDKLCAMMFTLAMKKWPYKRDSLSRGGG
jgi:hypothetical protein